MSLVLKRKNNSDAISAYDDAVMYYMILGDGVFNGVYSNFSGSYVSGTFSISAGIFLWGGRMIEISKGSSYAIDVSSITSTSTIYVIAEMAVADDDANTTINIYATLTKPTNGKPIAGTGTYRYLLFTLAPTTRLITENFTRIEPGIAKNTQNLLSTGKINGVNFWNIFLADMSGVLYARNADYAAEAAGFIGGDINRVNANLYMPNRGVYLMQDAVLVSRSGMGTSLAASSSIQFSFADPNALSNVEGVTTLTFSINGSGSSRVNNAGYFVEKGQTFKANNSLECLVNVSRKIVKITNVTTSSYNLDAIEIHAYCFGGA